MNTKRKGDISVSRIMNKLLLKGYAVLMPFGDSERYDLVIEDEGHFQRIQVKTGRIKNGAVVFDTSNRKYGAGMRSYRGEADLFGVCVEDKTYLIPVDSVPVIGASLRLMPTLNKQTKGIRFAKDFEI